ncbi:iron complex transport system ATP-binding protein [Natronobacillus azotifigens]|uniref:ABC transporter ATP-binding protein n=1 Tax=Natronobacillus azotifigens TaxID=472978 RepID=A0A9J6RBS9_9BACI|nr:ABC transporter ATP-binding protein [Natronobacillus azotifigens]MCZ0702764.1 ABC transporter ATP-binding protein [Natronobacillus azotifigens]
MVLELKGVGLQRNGSWILQDIDWTIKSGENWVLLGLNGAGKTALLHMLCGYYFPTKGEVTVLGRRFGKDIMGDELRRQIGIVSSTIQERFYDSDSAYQIVLSGGFASIGLYETPTDAMRDRAKELLKELGCYGYANRSFYTLSQGERQRVMIARALMADPKLLILDEPTNGLDFLAKEQLLSSIEQISQSKGNPTIIYVTHHVDEILPSFQKTLLLKEGRVFKANKTSEILTEQVLMNFFGVEVSLNWLHERPTLLKK